MGHLNSLTRGFGAAVLSMMLLVGAATAQGVETKNSGSNAVTLAYDRGADTLLKADAGALYRSVDGGQSWQKIVITPTKDGRITSLTASPASKGVIYVGGFGLGVLRTEDGGFTWNDRNDGLPTRDVIAVAAHTTQTDTVYAVVKDQGVYRSQDAGKSWRLMESRVQDGLRQLIHSDMAGSMESGWLFAATSNGIRRVMDCFCLWQDAGKLQSQAYSITYDPREPKHLYAATERGLFRSTDGGETWAEMATVTEVNSLTFGRSGELYAVNDNGTLFRSPDQGGTWREVNG